MIMVAIAVSAAMATGEAFAASGDIPFTEVTILADASGLPAPPCPACERLAVGERRVPGRPSPRAIILVGHSVPGSFLGMSAPAIARVIAAINPRPDVLILDTCGGADAEFLAELVRNGVTPGRTLAWPGLVAGAGFHYGPFLADGGLDLRRVDEVACCGEHAEPVTVIPGDRLAAVVDAAEATRQAHSECRYVGRDAARNPTMVAVPVDGVHGEVLVRVPNDLLAGCEPPPSAAPLRAPWRWLLVALISLFILAMVGTGAIWTTRRGG